MADTPTPRRLPPIELPPPGSGSGRRRRSRADDGAVDETAAQMPVHPAASPEPGGRRRPPTVEIRGPGVERKPAPRKPAPRRPAPRRREPVGADEGVDGPRARMRVDAPLPFDATPELESDRPRPAGLVLVVMVMALVVASLFDAPAMVERAENKSFDDPWRGPSTAIWGGINRVSETLRLDAPRAAIDRAIGRDDDGRDGLDVDDLLSERAASADPDGGSTTDTVVTTTTTIPDEPPSIRTPTEAEPLRVYVGGDSVSTWLTRSMQRIGGEIGVIRASPDTRVETGLSRPDYFNWPRHLADDVVPTDPEVVVLFLGANDGQSLALESGQICARFEQCWIDEYRRRVAGTMDLLRDPDGDRIVIWVGLPPFKPNTVRFPDTYSGIFAAEAATRPWVVYLDTWNVFADPAGDYTSRVTDAAGELTAVREPDGIHLTPQGGDRMAWEVIRAIAEVSDLSAWAGPEPAGETAPRSIPRRADPPEPEPRLID